MPRSVQDVKFSDPKTDSAPAPEPKPVKKYPTEDEVETIVVGIGENGETANVKVPNPYHDGEWIVIERNKPTTVPKYILGLLDHMVIKFHNKDGTITPQRRAPWHPVKAG